MDILERQAIDDRFDGYAIRRWPGGSNAMMDPEVGVLLFLESTAARAATVAWRLRALRSEYGFGVIRMVKGKRKLIGRGADSSDVSRTYINLEEERRQRFNAVRAELDYPGPVAA